jgi:hypothetical protein
MSGTSAFFFGCVLSSGHVDRALVDAASGELLDHHRIDDRRRDRRVAEHVLLDAGRVHDRRVEVDQRLAVGK